MYKIYQGFAVALVLAFFGFQVQAAALKIKNLRTKEPIGIQIENLGLHNQGWSVQTDTIKIIPPGETIEQDNSLGGFGKMKWFSCGRGYETNLDILGIDGWADITIGEGNTIFRTKSPLQPATAVQGKEIDVAKCPCVIQSTK